MNKDMIMSALEDQDLTQEQIADVVAELEKLDEENFDVLTLPLLPGTGRAQVENDLRNQMDAETDWRVKAKIAARLISISLD